MRHRPAAIMIQEFFSLSPHLKNNIKILAPAIHKNKKVIIAHSDCTSIFNISISFFSSFLKLKRDPPIKSWPSLYNTLNSLKLKTMSVLFFLEIVILNINKKKKCEKTFFKQNFDSLHTKNLLPL